MCLKWPRYYGNSNTQVGGGPSDRKHDRFEPVLVSYQLILIPALTVLKIFDTITYIKGRRDEMKLPLNPVVHLSIRPVVIIF